MTDNTGFIYLAAPYSTGLIATSPTVRRVAMLRRRHRIDTAQLISEGHVVYSPVSHGCAIEPHIRTTMTHADWLKQCRPLLMAARELRVLMPPGWRESRAWLWRSNGRQPRVFLWVTWRVAYEQQ